MKELLPRMNLQLDPSISGDFNDTYAVVTIALKDGRSVEKKVDRLTGWCGTPLTREERVRKFQSCVRRKLPEAAASRLLDLGEHLETLVDVDEMMSIVRC